MLRFRFRHLALGAILGKYAPGLRHERAPQLLVRGFFISTTGYLPSPRRASTLLSASLFGSRRLRCTAGRESRNNAFLSFFMLGEGWHNNHHRYQSSVRQGFYWWELDPSWWVLCGLSGLGLVSQLRPVPDAIYAEAVAGKKRSEESTEISPDIEVS